MKFIDGTKFYERERNKVFHEWFFATREEAFEMAKKIVTEKLGYYNEGTTQKFYDWATFLVHSV